jgi:hypothetical protein
LLYLLAFVWAFVLLANFAGWGLAVQRVLRLASHGCTPDWGQAIVLGMSLIVALGGFLSLPSLMMWRTVLSLVLAGLFLFAVEIWRLGGWARRNELFDWPKTKTDVLVILVCIVVFATWVCLPRSPFDDAKDRYRYTLNPWDDLQGGYVTYPFRLLSEGKLGDDPFNDRRSISALGGFSLLQAFPFLFLPPTYIHILDPGLAILALPLVLAGLARRHGWPPGLAGVLTLVVVVLKNSWANATPMILPILLFLSLYGLLDELAITQRAQTSQLVALALMAGALLTLKHTLIPGTCMIMATYLVLDWVCRRDIARTLVAAVMTCSVLLLLLAPWLISSYRAAGTPLFPLLGEGHRANPMVDLPHRVSTRDAAAEARDLVKLAINPRLLLYFLLGALGLGASMGRTLRGSRGTTYRAFLLGATPAVFLLARMFSHDAFVRYTYPYLITIYLISFALLLRTEEGRTWLEGMFPGLKRLVAGFLILIVLACAFYNCLNIVPNVRAVADTIAGRAWNPDSERATYRQLQASIPAARPFLAFLPMPHLLDFGRNPINVIDTDCSVSPPPGMPLKRSPEEVASYLRSLGISWIASRLSWWIPAGETKDPEGIRRWSEVFKGANQWDVSVVYSYYLVAKCMRALSTTYETSLFENDLVVIDLDRPRALGQGPLP